MNKHNDVNHAPPSQSILMDLSRMTEPFKEAQIKIPGHDHCSPVNRIVDHINSDRISPPCRWWGRTWSIYLYCFQFSSCIFLAGYHSLLYTRSSPSWLCCSMFRFVIWESCCETCSHVLLRYFSSSPPLLCAHLSTWIGLADETAVRLEFGSCCQSISCWIPAFSVTFKLFVVSAPKFLGSLYFDHL